MKCISIELYEVELNYLLTGLELFALNLNNIWAIKKDSEVQERRYHIILYLYHRLLGCSTNFDSYVQIKMSKPKNRFQKILHFKN